MTSAKNLFLWGHPRSLSTAMEVYFRSRGDFKVIHEPFGDCYWKGADPWQRLDDIQKQIESSPRPVFIKDIAHHIANEILQDGTILNGFQHAIVVRSPLAAFHSHIKVNPQVKPHEFGYAALYRVFNLIKEQTNKAPTIILADQIVLDPVKTIREFCEALGIEHISEALSWEAKQQSDWKAGEKWQNRAGKSTGFELKAKSDLGTGLGSLPKQYAGIFAEHQTHYNKLISNT